MNDRVQQRPPTSQQDTLDIDAAGLRLPFHHGGLRWSLCPGDDTYAAPEERGILLLTREDVRGSIVQGQIRYTPLQVFPVESLADPSVDDSLVEWLRIDAGAGSPLDAWFYATSDTPNLEPVCRGIRSALGLRPPLRAYI